MKVLLLDTAFAAVPIYDYLTQVGHEVWAIGCRPADPIARRAGSRWIEQDYSDVERVSEQAERLAVDYVVPGCTDMSIDTCVQLQRNPQLIDSARTNALLANKASFRQLCAELDLSAPRTWEEADFPRLGKFIAKPVDAFSGRGISIFDGEDASALDEAVAAARRESSIKELLIETFVEGDLYSCSGFIEKQRLTDVFYVREGASANPFAVDTSYVVSDLEPACIAILHESLHRLCDSLQLKDGLLHTQFILMGEIPYIVELTRRCPGDLYSLLIEYSTGYPYAAKYATYFTGASLDARCEAARHVLRHTVSSLEGGLFSGLQLGEPMPVRAYFPILPMGETLLPRQCNRAGILFTEVGSAVELARDFESFISRRAYEAAW